MERSSASRRPLSSPERLVYASSMRLSDLQKRMLDGALGEARQWAIAQQVAVLAVAVIAYDR